ncbi:hypothetical protein DFH09DRAFT_1162702, partial [Mycena vulgaris]
MEKFAAVPKTADLLTEIPHSADNSLPEVPVSDTDRLISAFSKELAELGRKNEEQTDRLQKAIEAMKAKPVVTDKETAFWTAYKTLADEHDREFHQKYSTDLDTSLIFAGLFSAVSSAFIIQIQPELRPGVDNPQPPTIIIAAQSLLYISLSTTLLAALLAVLGKQWLMHYGEAGNRGTLKERGLERQRKLEGVLKWRFDMVMQMFPLLLQFALFIFAAALAVYLWTVHHALALIVIVLASVGTIAYVALLISAIRCPDSPFQTPLARIVEILMEKLFKIVALLIQPLFDILHPKIQQFIPKIWTKTRGWWVATNQLMTRQSRPFSLPFFRHNSRSLDVSGMLPEPEAKGLFDDEIFPEPSSAVPAVLWVMETSTNPDLISAAASVVVDLQ